MDLRVVLSLAVVVLCSSSAEAFDYKYNLSSVLKVRRDTIVKNLPMNGHPDSSKNKIELSKRLFSTNHSMHVGVKTSMYIFPENFDVREKFGEMCPGIRKVYNQGRCKSSWAISIASVVSDRLCIITGGKQKTPLSAQHLLSCCLECCGCNGGKILTAWQWLMNNGIVTGSFYNDMKGCMPYMIPPARPVKYKSPGFGGDWATANLGVQHCTNRCRDGSRPEVTQIIGYELFSMADQASIMEQLINHGPLQVSMHFYEDFRYYKGGIYVHTKGKLEGEHSVKLIGWGTWNDAHYWLAMNSFGNTSWGINGLFMVPRNGKDFSLFGYATISPVFDENKTTAVSGIDFSLQLMLFVMMLVKL